MSRYCQRNDDGARVRTTNFGSCFDSSSLARKQPIAVFIWGIPKKKDENLLSPSSRIEIDKRLLLKPKSRKFLLNLSPKPRCTEKQRKLNGRRWLASSPIDQSSMIAPSSSTTVMVLMFSSATLPRLVICSASVSPASNSASSAVRLVVVRVGSFCPLKEPASVVVVAVGTGAFLGMVWRSGIRVKDSVVAAVD
jgi:hypothetical protein